MKRVTVVEFGGTISTKVLVEDLGAVLVVTSEREWEASQREAREPVVVGFRREFVVEEAKGRNLD
jgi:hypothetical protein